MLEFAVLLIFPWAMALSASLDLVTMTIPNKISLLLIAGFFLIAPFVGLGWADIALHVAAGMLLLVIGMVMFALGWLGGGDAKLLAATGLWFGLSVTLYQYIMLTAILGGVLALVVVYFRSTQLLPSFMAYRWVLRLHDKHQGIPYGVALALAALIVYPHTIYMTSLI